MSGATHTPGPWDIRDGALYGNAGFIKPYIADLNDDHMDEETEANAHLMASAPELLEALKTCREALLTLCHDSAFADDAPEFNEGGVGHVAAGEALQAITKAEGGVS